MSMSLIVKTYGALLIGALTATFLSGMNSLQTILYFRLFPKDSRTVKASVSAVWALDITHTALIWAAVWKYFIVNIGQIPKIDIMAPEFVPGAIVVTAVVTFIVHVQVLLYTTYLPPHRNYWISAPILFLALGRVGGAMATAGEMYRAGRFSVFAASRSEWVLSLGLVFAAMADVAIMVAMFALLKSSREKSISLDNVIDQLIRYTLEMGTVTALTAVASMIAWLVEPHSLIFGAFYVCIEKVYAISFMGSLITRHHLRQGNDSQNSQAWKMSRGAHLVNMNQASSAQMKSELPLQDIHVDVSQSIQYDDKASSSSRF
ncbi:hypothetical protein JOM56_015263 [Amanita muscaria]